MKNKLDYIAYSDINNKKDTFFTGLISKLISSTLTSENAHLIIKNLDPENTGKFDKYISPINEELIIKTSEINPGEGQISLCGDGVNFDYELYNDNKLIKSEKNLDIKLNKSTNIKLFNLTNNKRKYGSYKIDSYEKNTKLHQKYLVKINDINHIGRNLNYNKNFSNIIIKKGNGNKITCPDNIKIHLSLQESFEKKMKDLGVFSLNIYNINLPREFREILLAQTYETEISFICNKEFLRILTDNKFNFPISSNFFILNLKIC